MKNNIYVGNLSYSVTNETLEELFSTFGTIVSAKIITDRNTGRSKGFGFVEMSSIDEVEQAVISLNGTEHEGRKLKVDYGRERKKKRNFSKEKFSKRGDR